MKSFWRCCTRNIPPVATSHVCCRSKQGRTGNYLAYLRCRVTFCLSSSNLKATKSLKAWRVGTGWNASLNLCSDPSRAYNTQPEVWHNHAVFMLIRVSTRWHLVQFTWYVKQTGNKPGNVVWSFFFSSFCQCPTISVFFVPCFLSLFVHLHSHNPLVTLLQSTLFCQLLYKSFIIFRHISFLFRLEC